MRETLLKILNEYLTDKNKPFKGNPLANFLRHGAPESIKKTAHLTNKYLVEGSAGKSNGADIPWICVFDKEITKSAQWEYYIVYLFDANMQGVYLSLGVGWIQYKIKYKPVSKALREIKAAATHCQELIKSPLKDFPVFDISLHARSGLGKGYEAGCICGKYYPKESVPPTDELVDDLRNLLGAYRELKGYLSGRPITEKQTTGKALPNKGYVDNKEREHEEAAERLSTEELKKLAMGAETKPPLDVKTVHYPRDANVVAYVKRMADGKCKLCSRKAPFISKKGTPFLECHHIIERAEGGPDTIDNTVALCPNCHRKVHNLKLEEDKVKLRNLKQ
ncbi:MAG: MrcB family domain-containing protein [Planctomycetota bacterium]|jgi:5-methylcytosine-specific restriction protein A